MVGACHVALSYGCQKSHADLSPPAQARSLLKRRGCRPPLPLPTFLVSARIHRGKPYVQRRELQVFVRVRAGLCVSACTRARVCDVRAECAHIPTHVAEADIPAAPGLNQSREIRIICSLAGQKDEESALCNPEPTSSQQELSEAHQYRDRRHDSNDVGAGGQGVGRSQAGSVIEARRELRKEYDVRDMDEEEREEAAPATMSQDEEVDLLEADNLEEQSATQTKRTRGGDAWVPGADVSGSHKVSSLVTVSSPVTPQSPLSDASVESSPGAPMRRVVSTPTDIPPRQGESGQAGSLLAGRQTYEKGSVGQAEANAAHVRDVRGGARGARLPTGEHRKKSKPREEDSIEQGGDDSSSEGSPTPGARGFEQRRNGRNGRNATSKASRKTLLSGLVQDPKLESTEVPLSHRSVASVTASSAGGFSPLDMLMSAPPPPRHSAAARLARGRSRSSHSNAAREEGTAGGGGHLAATLPIPVLPKFPGLFRMELQRELHERRYEGTRQRKPVFLPDPDLF